MQENGPFLWQPGVFKPVANKWSWHHLTNVVWIDQPVGTGFSQGTPTATSEADVARQFLGFWKNFVDAFALQGFKVYVTGSSYSGMYCPYIASAMLDANDSTYFNVKGMQIFDGIFSAPELAQDLPAAAFSGIWEEIFAFNDSFRDSVSKAAQKCGYTNYLAKYLAFPPAGIQPAILPGLEPNGQNYLEGCDLFIQVFLAAAEVNPCFSPYTISNGCPLLYDPLGFSDGTMFVPEGSGPLYLNRADVKAAINAPGNTEWVFCTNTNVFVNGTDDSLFAGPGSQPVLPNVIDKTQNVIIGHGARDFVLMEQGTLLAIQNLTFGGKLGFQERPSKPLFVPYHGNEEAESLAGAGVVGTVHTERGLTYLSIVPSGHFVSMDTPALSFRSVEVLLGRVAGFGALVPFTTDVNATVQPAADSIGLGIGFGSLMSESGGLTAAASSNDQPQTAETSTSSAHSVASGRGLVMGVLMAVVVAIAMT
jgi:carboxypeptidase D